MQLWLHWVHASCCARSPHRAHPAARRLARCLAVPADRAAAGAQLGLDVHGRADCGDRGNSGSNSGGGRGRRHTALPRACRGGIGRDAIFRHHPPPTPRLQLVRPLPRWRAAAADVAVVGHRCATRQRPRLDPGHRHRPPRHRQPVQAPSGLRPPCHGARHMPRRHRSHAQAPQCARPSVGRLLRPRSSHVMSPPLAAHPP